jgi:hypothetical protein
LKITKTSFLKRDKLGPILLKLDACNQYIPCGSTPSI